jgi:hypothetical protein
VVAEHDGGVGLDDDRPGVALASGPGNYRVTVRRPGSTIPGAQAVPSQWPIELSPVGLTSSSEPFKMNPGMARWFGLRLIEAAAICEAFDVAGGASRSVAPSEIKRLSDFLMEQMPDSIGEGSAVDNAIRLLSVPVEAPTDAPQQVDWQEKDRADFIETLNRMVQPGTQLWHTARDLFEEGAPVDCVVYGLERTLRHSHLSHQTSAYLRGVVKERVRRAGQRPMTTRSLDLPGSGAGVQAAPTARGGE